MAQQTKMNTGQEQKKPRTISQLMESGITTVSKTYNDLSEKTVKARDPELDNIVSDLSKCMDKMRDYLRLVEKGEKDER